jgi:hypothetical protein
MPQDFDRQMVGWTRALSVATIIIAIATASSGFFILKQWQSVTDAQNDAREQLRAYVTFDGGSQIVNDDARDPQRKTINYIFASNFHNWGATRTSKFSAWASVSYFEKDVPNSQDFSKPYESVPVEGTIIGANSVVTLYVSLKTDDAIKAKNKQGVVIIWGHAEWADIYSANYVKPINFCLKLEPVSSDGDNRIIFHASPYKTECNTGS